MVDKEVLSDYYKAAEPFYHRFLKEIFSRQDIAKLEEAAQKGSVITQDQLPLDSMFLFEARNFLRLSVFNLLAYKLLMCGRHLAWGKVTLYYSYFYSVSCLLRLAGFAVVHPTNLDGKVLSMRLVRQHNSHDYRIMSMRGNEHRLVWNTFSTLYPNLSTQSTGKLTIDDRVRWNYDLLYPSQITEEHAVREAEIFCENNFLDPNFGNFSDADAAEYFHDLIANYGYEEMYAGDLIRESISTFVIIAKTSRHKNDYVGFLKSLIEEANHFETKNETRSEVKKWLQNAIDEISR